jgi:hypothetical protein
MHVSLGVVASLFKKSTNRLPSLSHKTIATTVRKNLSLEFVLLQRTTKVPDIAFLVI